MKKIFICILLAFLETASFAQMERLHTTSAKLYSDSEEHRMIAHSIFPPRSSGYYDIEYNEGFYLDYNTSEIVYFSYEEDWDGTTNAPRFSSPVCKSMKLDKKTFDIIYDLYHIVVSTSTPEIPEALSNPSYFFIYNKDVAECRFFKSNETIITLSRDICRRSGQGDPSAIEALLPIMLTTTDLYKGMMLLEPSLRDDSVIVGSIASRVFVGIHFFDFDELDKSTQKRAISVAKRLASHLLFNSSHQVWCDIEICEDRHDAMVRDQYDYSIWMRKKDLSYKKVVKMIESLSEN